MATSNNQHRFSILIINPNTSAHMTDALKPILGNLHYPDVHFDYFTAPSREAITLPDGRPVHGVPSINSAEGSAQSALHCRPFVESLMPEYDAFLVACYSAHPLVGMLKEEIRKHEETNTGARRKYVTGIFEASIVTALSLISSFQFTGDSPGSHKAQAQDTFGIVSTGSVWETELSNAVRNMLGSDGKASTTSTRFTGVATTGLTAVELHTTPSEEVKQRISDATERLIRGTSNPVDAICMGCAGMAGMEQAVREGCIRAYGKQQGNRVRIVDGVIAGAGMLVTACKAGF